MTDKPITETLPASIPQLRAELAEAGKKRLAKFDAVVAAVRKVRSDLTQEEKDRLAKFGSVDHKSAGALRKR